MPIFSVIPIEDIVMGQNRVQRGLPQSMLPNFVEEWKRPGQRMSWPEFFQTIPPEYQQKALQDKLAYEKQKAQNNPGSFGNRQPGSKQVNDPRFSAPTSQTEPVANPTPQTPGSIWNSIRNWFNGKQQPQTEPVSAMSAPELANSLSQAIRGFSTAYNTQIRTFNPAIQSINQVIQGLASQQGSQMLQFNPQISAQVQQLIQSLNNASREEAMDQAFISQLAQQAQTLAKTMLPSTRAAMRVTASMATPSTLFLK